MIARRHGPQTTRRGDHRQWYPGHPYLCVAFLARGAADNERMPVRVPPDPDRGRPAALRASRMLASLTGRGPLASSAVRVWTFTAFLVAVAVLGYLL